MFIPATNNHINSYNNYDYYTLLIIMIVIYLLHINYLYEANKVLKKKLEDMELTIKMNSTNINDKITKLRQEVEANNLETFNEKLILLSNKLIIINEQVEKYKETNKKEMVELEKCLKDISKKLKTFNNSNQFVMTGTYYYTPLLVYKGTDNLLKSIISNNIENSLLLENVEYFNIFLSALVKFKNVKEIDLTKIHKYANIVDDDGKMIWSKREDTLSEGYEMVVTYLNNYKVKFI